MSLDNYRTSAVNTDTILINVVLIDIAGFDHTNCIDTEISKETAQVLAQYIEEPNIDGVFYLYRIDNNHLRRSSSKNLVLFGETIEGGRGYTVVFTSMWKINPILDRELCTQGCDLTDGSRSNTKNISGHDSLIICLGYDVSGKQAEFALLEYGLSYLFEDIG
jgi:GTP-binding protein EngB required for normal cell division